MKCASEVDPVTDTIKPIRELDRVAVKPPQLWGLWIPEGGREKRGSWVLAIDCAGDPILAYTSEQDAKDGRDYHEANYEIDAVVLPLK